jgi:glycosyltransferase involved in cell wall biosynthesis
VTWVTPFVGRSESEHGPLFVSWYRYHGRSATLAKELEAEAIFVAVGRTGNAWSALLRYVAQSVYTLAVMLAKRPRTIIVMAPPLPLTILAWVVGKLTQSRLIIDAHTGVFNDPKWAWALRPFLWFARRSTLTIVTNTHLVNELEKVGVKAASLHDPPASLCTERTDGIDASNKADQDMVIVPLSFSSDEPIDAIVMAAEAMPNVTFYLTGAFPQRSPVDSIRRPTNVLFTGYLPNDEYEALFRSATVVVALTTRELTMQRAGYEALSCHKPLLTSDTQVLREYFTRGALFTSSLPHDIRAGIMECLENRNSLSESMAALHSEKLASWHSEMEVIKKELS